MAQLFTNVGLNNVIILCAEYIAHLTLTMGIMHDTLPRNELLCQLLGGLR